MKKQPLSLSKDKNKKSKEIVIGCMRQLQTFNKDATSKAAKLLVCLRDFNKLH